MSNQRTICVNIKDKYEFGEGSTVCMVIDSLFENLDSIRTADGFDLMFGCLSSQGEVSVTEGWEKETLRKDACDRIAKEISGMLVELLSKDDTHNGYSKERES